jgi:hypothetical protein
MVTLHCLLLPLLSNTASFDLQIVWLNFVISDDGWRFLGEEEMIMIFVRRMLREYQLFSVFAFIAVRSHLIFLYLRAYF